MSELPDLSALLAARSAAVFGEASAPWFLRPGPPLRWRTTDRCDLALYFGDQGAAALESKAKLAVVAGGRGAPPNKVLRIGHTGGLWLPGLRLGIDEGKPGPEQPKSTRKLFIISQQASVAEYLVLASLHRGLAVSAALATGEGGTHWTAIAQQLRQLPNPPLLVVALQQAVTPSELLAAASGAWGQPPLLLLSHGGHTLAEGFGALPHHEVDTAQLATALGWAVFSSPLRLFAAAAIWEAGLCPRHGCILPMVRHRDEAALLLAATDEAGLRRAPLRPSVRISGLQSAAGALISPGRQHLVSRALAKIDSPNFDAIVCAGRVPRVVGVDTPQLSLGPSPVPPPALAADETTLHALATLLRLPRRQALAAQTGPRQRPQGALPADLQWLIGSGPPMLGEARTKRLIAHFGIKGPPEHLTTSASGASAAARELGFPVTIKAIGPHINRPLREHGTVAALSSASAVRQAFRDVLFDCEQELPDTAIDGVMVSKFLPGSEHLNCLVIWLSGRALLRVFAYGPRSRRAADRCYAWRQCPLSSQDINQLADELLTVPDSESDELAEEGTRQALGELLAQLSRLAQGSRELRWLQLERVLLPTQGPARVLMAQAERTPGV